MRRSFLTFVAVALFGTLLTASNASACHHKKAKCAPACEPVACAPAPVCEPAPECAPKKKCHLKLNLGGMFKCHKKVACAAPAPVCETVVYEAAPVAPSAQWVAPSGQASAQH